MTEPTPVEVIRDAGRNWRRAYTTCPCGAWLDRLSARGHVIACPVEQFDAALASLEAELAEARETAVMLADLVSRLRPALGQMNQVMANPSLYSEEQVAAVKREAIGASLFAAGRVLRYGVSPLYPLMTATTDDERERLSQAALTQPQEASDGT